MKLLVTVSMAATAMAWTDNYSRQKQRDQQEAMKNLQNLFSMNAPMRDQFMNALMSGTRDSDFNFLKKPTRSSAPGKTLWAQVSNITGGNLAMRSVSYGSQGTYDVYNNYGCWCYFDSQTGKGQPMDSYDEYCKTLQQGYACIIADATATTITDQACLTPWNVEATGVQVAEVAGIRTACDTLHTTGTCNAAVCIVESYFLYLMGEYILNFPTEQPNEDYFHYDRDGDGDLFTPSTDCTSIGNPDTFQELRCCGEFPNRKPYRHNEDAGVSANLRICCPGNANTDSGSVSTGVTTC